MSNDIFPRESRAERLKVMSRSAGAEITIDGDHLIVRGDDDSRAIVLRRAMVAAKSMGFEIGYMTGATLIITVLEAR